MNEATSSSATPRTKATAKTTAKAAATKTTRTAAKSTAKTTTKKPTTKRTSKPKTATKRTVGETPAPIINRTSPEQFGRVNVLDITPSAENGLYPARVELGEAFKVTAQVRGKLRANHVTQRELADSVGMSEQALSNKLRGLKNFTLRDVSRIADFFDVSTGFVLGREPLEVK